MDPSTIQLNTLYQRANATSDHSDSSDERPPIFKVVGIILAISSGLFIGVSFVLKKHGLLKANVKYNEEAGEGYGYLKNAYWWTGMTLMILGEICNFVAYGFVDAILVTPLGALSVVVTTILSAIFLKERLSFVGMVGCFLCIVGSIVIVLNAPEQSAVANIQDMQKLVLTPGFLSYAGVVIVGCAAVAFYVGPRYGKKSMMVYLTICSLIGGLSVVATQGLGASIIAQIGGKSQFKEPFIYILLVFVIATLLTEIVYLNKALNLFNAALVTPTYYVYFTSATIVTSAVLFQGFKGTPASITTVIMGFLEICAGVVLLQMSKSSKDVPDAAVFRGDLNQTRTIVDQEEPEYEPRADTIRGGGSILRSISKQRNRRQTMEVKKLQEEHMSPIGENEKVEFDGLRRRKTVIGDDIRGPGDMPGSRGGIRRVPVPSNGGVQIHPPLGMSQFPDDEADRASINSDEDTHPGFFARLRSPSKSSKKSWLPSPIRREQSRGEAHAKLSGTQYLAPPESMALRSAPPTQGDFSKSAAADSTEEKKSTHELPPLPTGAKRQFSFQKMFRRRSTDDSAESPGRPSSSGRQATIAGSGRVPFADRGLSSRGSAHRYGASGTEEESLGLVKGDSTPAHDGRDDADRSSAELERSPAGPSSDPPPYEDSQGYLVPRLAPLGGRPVGKGIRSVEQDTDDDDHDDYDGEKGAKGWRRG